MGLTGPLWDPENIAQPLVKAKQAQQPVPLKLEDFSFRRSTIVKHNKYFSHFRNGMKSAVLYGMLGAAMFVWWGNIRPVLDRLPIVKEAPIIFFEFEDLNNARLAPVVVEDDD